MLVDPKKCKSHHSTENVTPRHKSLISSSPPQFIWDSLIKFTNISANFILVMPFIYWESCFSLLTLKELTPPKDFNTEANFGHLTVQMLLTFYLARLIPNKNMLESLCLHTNLGNRSNVPCYTHECEQ